MDRLEALLRGGVQGATGGWGDEGSAALLQLLSRFQDDGTGIPREYAGGQYEQYRNQQRADNAEAQRKYPKNYLAGNIAGSLPGMVLAAPVGGAGAVALGTGLGALEGAGYSDREGLDLAKDAAAGAALGGGIGAGAEAVKTAAKIVKAARAAKAGAGAAGPEAMKVLRSKVPEGHVAKGAGPPAETPPPVPKDYGEFASWPEKSAKPKAEPIRPPPHEPPPVDNANWVPKSNKTPVVKGEVSKTPEELAAMSDEELAAWAERKGGKVKPSEDLEFKLDEKEELPDISKMSDREREQYLRARYLQARQSVVNEDQTKKAMLEGYKPGETFYPNPDQQRQIDRTNTYTKWRAERQGPPAPRFEGNLPPREQVHLEKGLKRLREGDAQRQAVEQLKQRPPPNFPPPPEVIEEISLSHPREAQFGSIEDPSGGIDFFDAETGEPHGQYLKLKKLVEELPPPPK